MSRLILLAAALPAFAQMIARAPAPTISPDQPHLSFDVISSLEKDFDAKLAATPAGKEPFDLVGSTRGLYMPGFGMILTAEVDLILTPGASALFNRVPAPEDRAQVHTRKLQQLQVLQKVMRNMMASSADRLDIIPDNERVVLAVRLLYRHWEDVTGLPRQIVMSADRKSAIAGQIKEEISR